MLTWTRIWLCSIATEDAMQKTKARCMYQIHAQWVQFLERSGSMLKRPAKCQKYWIEDLTSSIGSPDESIRLIHSSQEYVMFWPYFLLCSFSSCLTMSNTYWSWCRTRSQTSLSGLSSFSLQLRFASVSLIYSIRWIRMLHWQNIDIPPMIFIDQCSCEANFMTGLSEPNWNDETLQSPP